MSKALSWNGLSGAQKSRASERFLFEKWSCLHMYVCAYICMPIHFTACMYACTYVYCMYVHMYCLRMYAYYARLSIRRTNTSCATMSKCSKKNRISRAQGNFG